MTYRPYSRLAVICLFVIVPVSWISGCAGVEEFQEFEVRDELAESVRQDDRSKISDLTSGDSSLLRGDTAHTMLFFAACRPELTEFMVGEVGFDPQARAAQSGHNLVYSIVANPPDGCNQRDLAKSLEIYLEKGVDPCEGIDGVGGRNPAEDSAHWGNGPVVNELMAKEAWRCE